MKLEKIIKHEKGKLTVNVSLWISKLDHETDINGNKFRYDVHTVLTPKGKRKPLYGENYNYLLTEDQIQEAKAEFWNLIKP